MGEHEGAAPAGLDVADVEEVLGHQDVPDAEQPDHPVARIGEGTAASPW